MKTFEFPTTITSSQAEFKHNMFKKYSPNVYNKQREETIKQIDHHIKTNKYNKFKLV